MKALLVLLATLLTPMTSAQADALKILYAEQSPYTMTLGRGHVGGVVGARVSDILKQAGIAFEWILMSDERHLKTIKANRRPLCAVGWGKTPERSKYGVFSEVIYQDKATIALVRSDNKKVQLHDTLASLFADKSLIFGAEYGHSYGPFVDAQISQIKPKTVTTAQDTNGLFLMMTGRRFDYILISGDAVKATLEETNFPSNGISVLKFSDLPKGKQRAFMCSQSVSSEIIDALNSSIRN